MTVGLFLHPGLIAAGLAAGLVPILIHLFSRRRVKRVRWAAMAWLSAALKRHQKRLRIENWLVLLLRVAALALLGVGLARFIWTDSDAVNLLRPKRSIVLLLDTSYSTGAKDGGRSVSDRVRAEADRVLSGLSSEDTIAVLVSNDVRSDRTGVLPAVLVPRTVGREGQSRAKEAVGQMRPTPTEAPASWPAALILAASKPVMPPDDVNRTLYWITDFQASDWRRPEPGAEDALAKAIEALERAGCAIRIVDAGALKTARRNLAVAEVSRVGTSDLDLFEGEDVDLRVVAWNFGPGKVSRASLRVFVDDSPSPTRSVLLDPMGPADPRTLKPGECTTLVRLGRDTVSKTPGPHSIRVQISPGDADAGSDLLSLDSDRRLALDVRKRLRVAAWVEKIATSQVAPEQILTAVYTGEGKGGDPFELRVARNGEGELHQWLTDASWEPDLVVLANTTPRGADTVRDLATFVRNGGALVVFVGDLSDTETLNTNFYAPASTRLLPFAFGRPEHVARDTGASWRLDLEKASANPLSKRIAGENMKWLREMKMTPQVWGRVPMLSSPVSPRGITPPGVSAEEQEAVVLRFEGAAGQTGPVAVAESRYGQGHALWVGTGLDDGWLDRSFYFLPLFLHEAALHLTRHPETGRNLLVGGAIRASIPRDAASPRLAVPGRGIEVPEMRAAASEADRPEVAYERTGTSGIYRLSYDRPGSRTSTSPGGAGGDRSEEFFAVNPDPLEGALARAEDSDAESRVPGADVKVLSSVEQEVETAKGAREGEMTPYILLAVVLLLLLEQFLAMKFGRHGAPEAPP